MNGGTLFVESCIDEKGSDMITVIKEGDRLFHTDEKLKGSKKRTIKTKTGFSPQSDLI